MDPGDSNEIQINDAKHDKEAPASLELSKDKGRTEDFRTHSDIRNIDISTGSERRDQQPNARPASSTAETNRSSSDTNAPSNSYPLPKVNFAKLETARLWDYCRFYGIKEINDSWSRDQLLNAVNFHFVSQTELKEEEVMSKFAVAVVTTRRRKSISRR